MEHNFEFIAKTLKARSTVDSVRQVEDLLLDLCGLSGEDLVVEAEQLASAIADAYTLNGALPKTKSVKKAVKVNED